MRGAVWMLAGLVLGAVAARAAGPLEVQVASFPDAGSEKVEERSKVPGRPDRAVSEVGAATLTITWPEKRAGQPTPAVLVCPGGSYARLIIDKEGREIARWLNEHGYIAALLKYRLPRPGQPRDLPVPIADGQAAMRILRRHADEWGIRKNGIGILGCSAGGHLASAIATHFESGDPAATDPPRRETSRPDFQILVYPLITMSGTVGPHAASRRNLLGDQPEAARLDLYSNEKHVTPQTPPAFLVHARDDPAVPVVNSELYAAALARAGVPCEFVKLSSGGHGFGLGVKGGEPLKWPPLCLAWLEKNFPPAPE